MKKRAKKLVAIMVGLALVIIMAVPTLAAAPFKDVTKKTFGKNIITSVSFVKKYGGYDGLVKGKKLHPKQLETYGYALKKLCNLYGKKCVLEEKDKKLKKNKPITEKWLRKKLEHIAKERKRKISYKNSPWLLIPMTHVTVDVYIYGFATSLEDPALMPNSKK